MGTEPTLCPVLCLIPLAGIPDTAFFYWENNESLRKLWSDVEEVEDKPPRKSLAYEVAN